MIRAVVYDVIDCVQSLTTVRGSRNGKYADDVYVFV